MGRVLKQTARKTTGGMPLSLSSLSTAEEELNELNEEGSEPSDDLEVINVSSGEEDSELSTESLSGNSNEEKRGKRKTARKSTGAPPPASLKDEEEGGEEEEEEEKSNEKKVSGSKRTRPRPTMRKSTGGLLPPGKTSWGEDEEEEEEDVFPKEEQKEHSSSRRTRPRPTMLKSTGGVLRKAEDGESGGPSSKISRSQRTQARKSTGVPPKWRSEQVDSRSDESDTESDAPSASGPPRGKHPKGGKNWRKILAHNSNSESQKGPLRAPSVGARNGNGKAGTETGEPPEAFGDEGATLEMSPEEERLSDESLARESILKLEGWNLKEATDPSSHETFWKEYLFKGFNEAWDFMSKVTIQLQIMNHHPDWHQINNKVKVSLPSSDSTCLSSKDSLLAQFMDEVAEEITEIKEVVSV